MKQTETAEVAPSGEITHLIRCIREQRVILDADLAFVYGVETKVLNRAVKRNPLRFPEEFVFRLTSQEWTALRCQIGTLKVGRGQHRKYLPHAFTEHGALMAASVLNTGLVQFCSFLGSNYGSRALSSGLLTGTASRRWSIPGEPRVAEHFQPVRVGFARQQFRRALTDAFRSLTPQEAAMIEEELEQGQIVR